MTKIFLKLVLEDLKHILFGILMVLIILLVIIAVIASLEACLLFLLVVVGDWYMGLPYAVTHGEAMMWAKYSPLVIGGCALCRIVWNHLRERWKEAKMRKGWDD